MDSMGIASTAMNMKMAYVQTEVSFRVMKMTLDISKQACSAVVEMMDAAITGVGENFDIIA